MLESLCVTGMWNGMLYFTHPHTTRKLSTTRPPYRPQELTTDLEAVSHIIKQLAVH